MKKLIIAFVAFAAVLFAGEVSAQKIGHINSAELIDLMPEKGDIKKKLEAHAKMLENQMTAMRNEYQSKTTEYQANEGVWTDLIKQAKIQDIASLEKRIQEFQQSAQQDLAKKEQELAGPLLEKAQKAIKDVAKANGYTYVLDTSSGVVLHFPEGQNILPLVKKHLGIQ